MILVTGATGNVGSEVVKILSKKGESLRVVTRDEKKLSHLDSKVERVIGDLVEPATVEKALKGVDRIFMFPLVYEQDHKSNKMLVDAAKKAGVKKIVMLSSLGAGQAANEIGQLHRQKEEVVEKSGIAWTFLRPGGFMTNSLQWIPTIKGQGKVFNPMGDGKIAPISAHDIAAVAAVTLTSEGHDGKIYELTGPELLTTREQVEQLSASLGKEIECVDVPVSVAAEQVTKSGAPPFLVSGLSKMWQQIKEGKASTVSHEVQTLTGEPGETFKQWCEKNRASFLN